MISRFARRKNNPSPRYLIGGSEWVVSFTALYILKVFSMNTLGQATKALRLRARQA
jgi:hypothetical protein